MAYTIGIDFGTLSGRAVLVDVATGAEMASAALDYPHGVMDTALPDGIPLGKDWALQHPQDYLDVLAHTIPAVLRKAGVSAGEVVGVGVDCTANSVLPVRADGMPLCFLPQYRSVPHAYVKLWKHHAAQGQARRMTELARQRGERWLARYGGKVSSEWMHPKLLQILEEAPEVYAAADHFVEITDWIVWQLTGQLHRSACARGYKALWHRREGWPAADYFAALDPRFVSVCEEKLGGPALPQGARAGGLCPAAAALTGLRTGTAVAVGNVDAHACVPAVGITGPGKLLAILGTSTCHMLMGTAELPVPGICGVVEDGILPGLYGYEAGQSCVGDLFAWYIDRCLPASYRDEAAGGDLHAFLRERAQRLVPGESGLLALDWFNGNRSILVDPELSGLLLGMNLQTRPEEIYRALIEATAYGTRKIVETFEVCGLPVEEVCAAGGIAGKDPMTMQIYADVLNRPIRIAGSANGPALGAAIFAAVAAGGYGSVSAAAAVMGKCRDTVYRPDPAHVAVYDRLYAEYALLHDYFGGINDVMKRLRDICRDAEA